VREKVKRTGGKIADATRLLWELLREIGDENAYRRHLQLSGSLPSGSEWRKFADERMRAKYQRAKCC
jgi:hypothetical protein